MYPYHLFRYFPGNLPSLLRSSEQLPSNIKEEDAAFVVEMALPGVQRQHVQISLEDNYLAVTVEKTNAKADNKTSSADSAESPTKTEAQYLHLETNFSELQLQRRFHLGKGIDRKAIEAKLQDGLLTIRIGKKAAEKRSIAIA